MCWFHTPNPDPKLAALWRNADAASFGPPEWRNSRLNGSFRSYSGGDARLEIEGDVLRLAIVKSGRYIAWLSLAMLPAFLVFGAFLPFNERILFGVLFSVTYPAGYVFCQVIVRHNEELGDYIVVDRAAKRVELPRLKTSFPLGQVQGFQWIRGRSVSDYEVDTDLNLIVLEPEGLVRYFVIGSPSRSIFEEIVLFSGIPLVEMHLDRPSCRDADCDTAKRSE